MATLEAPERKNPQRSAAWRALGREEQRSDGEMSGSDRADHGGRPRSETRGQKFTFLSKSSSRGSPEPGSELRPRGFFQGSSEWAWAASESEVSAVWGAPGVQYPGVPPTSRRKRAKSGAEPARDLGGYSWSKTLEMAAKGAGSPDSSPRPFLQANPSPATIQFTVYA